MNVMLGVVLIGDAVPLNVEKIMFGPSCCFWLVTDNRD